MRPSRPTFRKRPISSVVLVFDRISYLRVACRTDKRKCIFSYESFATSLGRPLCDRNPNHNRCNTGAAPGRYGVCAVARVSRLRHRRHLWRPPGRTTTPEPLWVVRVGGDARCCIRICCAMVGVPHRPILPSLPTTLPTAALSSHLPPRPV